MTIPVLVEVDKIEIKNFAEAEEKIFEVAMEFGRKLFRQILELRDLQLLAERDKERYRCKGLRSTHIKTYMGDMDYARRVYQDITATGEDNAKKCVYLLDEELAIDKIGHISATVCKQVANVISESSYRATARQISKQTGGSISAQGAWNLVQGMGKKLGAQNERNAELDEAHAGKGEISTKILYEENDGVWLNLQGQSRKENGPSKEMKVGIAYDGVKWKISKDGKKRRTLNNKVAYAAFLPISEYRRLKEGRIASMFSKDAIELRVVNGDGGAWTQQKQSSDCICVLDEFHRNKKLKECVRDQEFAQTLRKLLYENKIDELLECLEAQINSVTDEKEIADLKTLQRYYTENKDALKGYYDRGIDIPETREPGVIHHARLGSMESNVFTLIGNRMKDRRACWSIDGGNNLAAILCAYHTTGLEDIFMSLPEVPAVETEKDWIDDGKPISASKMPLTSGAGHEHQHNISTTNFSEILRSISTFSPLSALSL